MRPPVWRLFCSPGSWRLGGFNFPSGASVFAFRYTSWTADILEPISAPPWPLWAYRMIPELMCISSLLLWALHFSAASYSDSTSGSSQQDESTERLIIFHFALFLQLCQDRFLSLSTFRCVSTLSPHLSVHIPVLEPVQKMKMLKSGHLKHGPLLSVFFFYLVAIQLFIMALFHKCVVLLCPSNKQPLMRNWQQLWFSLSTTHTHCDTIMTLSDT